MTVHQKPLDSCSTVLNRNGEEIRVPDEFICPISLEPMSHPLMTITGLSFEREHILKWIQKKGTNPITREPLTPSALIPNKALEARISFWRINNSIEEETADQLRSTMEFVGFVKYEKDSFKSQSGAPAMSLLSLTRPGRSTQSEHNSRRRSSPQTRRRRLLNILSAATNE